MDLVLFAAIAFICIVALYMIFQLCIGLYAIRKADKEMKKMQKDMQSGFEDDFFN